MTEIERNPIRAGDIVSDELARHIYIGIVHKTLPRAEWTHQAHLVFATVLLNEKGIAGAEGEAPRLIRAYNESLGGVNDDTQGYHHTITLFFLRHIYAFYAPLMDQSIGERATRLLASSLAETNYPLRHYSKALLFSVGARRGWIEPDL